MKTEECFIYKIAILAICGLLSAGLSYSQSVIYPGGVSRFIKTVEYNYSEWRTEDGEINLLPETFGKSIVQCILFGDFNAPVEYYVEPLFGSAYGFRIFKQSSDGQYILETKKINNWQRTYKVDEKNKTEINYDPLQMTTDKWDELKLDPLSAKGITLNNKEVHERCESYQIDTTSLSVSVEFAEKLYQKTSHYIINFKGVGYANFYVEGNPVTWSCVLEDEVWTLLVYVPAGQIKELSDLCDMIMTDAEAGNFDETKYLIALEEL